MTLDMLGDTPIRCRENSGRCLLPYRAATGLPTKRVLAGELGKVEVLGYGQQFVAHGVHPSGAELYWYPDPPEVMARDALPAVTEDQVTAFLAAAASLIGADPHAGDHPHADEEREHGADDPPALDAAGGAEYLLRQTKQNPVAFMSLLGKLLPTQMTGKDGGPILNVFDPATLTDAELAARIDRLRRTAIVDGTPAAEELPDEPARVVR